MIIIHLLYMDNNSLLNNSADKINKLYSDLNYYDVYGGSVIIFIILVIILLLVYSYTSIMTSIQPIKDNWAVERCNPKVIPFAGFINKPEGSTIVQYTEENFNYCMQNILTSITGYAVEPLTFVTSGLTSLYGEIGDSLNSMRTVISNVRTNTANIAKEILGRILNIMTPIQLILISFIDMMGKMKGIFAAGIYTSLGTYYTLKSLMGAILQFIVMILIVLAALIAGMWIVPFTWPAAITGTTVFLSISIPLLIIMTFMNKVLHVNINTPIPSVPGPGHCFDKKTQLLMKDGTYKSIEAVKLGDELARDGKITAKLKLDAKKVDMYNLRGVIVSGCHKVKFGRKWISVKDHPERIIILNYGEPYIYCLNTSLKRITISNTIFSDWDEIFEKEAEELLGKCESKNLEDIHKYYDGGFYFDTKVELSGGEWREISNLKIGEVLRGGETITGIVEILGEDIVQLVDTGIDKLLGINIHSVNLNECSDLEKNCGEKKRNKNLYHLITDKKSFYVGEVKYHDYNSCVELFSREPCSL